MSDYVPPFRQSDAVMNLLAEACELVGRMEGEHRETLSVHLRRQNQIRSIHASLHIEQNTLTQEQITAILDGKRVLGPPREILEVKNAAEAYALLQELNPLAERDLLRAHRAMMQSLVRKAGCFRKCGVGVMAGDRAIHIAPPAHLVPYQIRDLLSWYGKSKLHPLLKSSVFHYEFEFIHPFDDGNGRMGRLWHTLLLSRWRSFFAWLPIEELIAERQQEYYRVLQEADSRGECSCFVQLMLEVIRDTLSQFSATSRPAGDLAGAENDQAAAKSDQAAPPIRRRRFGSCSRRSGRTPCLPLSLWRNWDCSIAPTSVNATWPRPCSAVSSSAPCRTHRTAPTSATAQPTEANETGKTPQPGKELRREIRMFCELRPSSWNRKPCSSPPRASREPADPPARSCSRCRHRKERDRA